MIPPAADALTALRMVIAVALMTVVAHRRLEVGTALLATAWWSDLLDGRPARAAGERTRLGHLDLEVDTAVGAGVLVGLALGGYASVGAVAIVIVLGGVFLRTANEAVGLLLQTVAYTWFMGVVWINAPQVRWLLPAVAGALLALDFDRFIHIEVPRFVGGVAALGRVRPPSDGDAADGGEDSSE